MGAILLAACLALAVQPQVPLRPETRAARTARVEQLMKDGEAARQAELLEEAIRIYSEVVKLAPRRAEAWWYLGLAHYDRDQYVEAERAFARLVVLDPQHGARSPCSACPSIQNGKYDLALKHLLAARTAREPLPAARRWTPLPASI